MQASRGACFDTGRFKSGAYAIRTKSALEDLLRLRVELRDIEWAAGNAITAADAILLLKINNAIDVLDDGPIGRTGSQTTGVCAVHALVFAHQPHEIAVIELMLIELDQVPVVPLRRGHRLIGVVEGRLTKRIAVPFNASHLAGFASDACRHIY